MTARAVEWSSLLKAKRGIYVNKNLIGSVIGALVATVITFGAIKYSGPPVVAAPESVPAVPVAVVVVDPNVASVQITAPETIRVGELAVLDVSASNADSIVWKVRPETSNFKVFDAGRVAVFSAEAPGEYLFFVSAAKGGTVDSKIHTIKVGQGAAPVKPDLGVKVPAWINKVESPGKRDEAIRLAQSFSSVAAMVTPTTSAADIVSMTVKSNRDALGSNIKAWEPFLMELQAELEASAANGSLSDGNSHVEAWRAISQALTNYAQSVPATATSAKVRGR